MFADVVGYSALMQASEPHAVAVRTRYQHVLRAQHAAFGGTVVQLYGDGALTMFDSSVAAVQCAAAIQRQCRDEPVVPLRIGIHAGDVIVDKDNVIGDAVNIASRIESFGVAGVVLVSDAVRDQVHNQPDFDFVDLGSFRLKNVGRPYEIYALAGDGLAVPDADLVRGKGERFASLPSNLPNPVTPLIGRDDDVVALLDLLEQTRAVTVTGAGGMGKTRLAIEVGQRSASRFLDGVSFVDLAPVRTPDDLMAALARALDVREAEERSIADGIAALIGDKQALLLLDNFEQLVAAAREIASLLDRCPQLRMLITSQTPLHIAHEVVYRLRPLGLPSEEVADVSSLEASPSVALFVARARVARPGFALTDDNAPAVVAICRRLDGSPLAIGLAAARVGMLPPAALLARLDHALALLTGGARDTAMRHRTLRATIDWSHSLLIESQQRLFRLLAVFAGDTDLEAIEGICTSDSGVLDDLEFLVDMGLVQLDAAADRFTMLETIREYAKDKLESSTDAEAVRRAHAEHFARRAVSVAAGIEGPDQEGSLTRGVRDEPNIRAALNYLLARASSGDEQAAEMGLRTCGELWMFWHIRARHISARSYSRAFLDIRLPSSTPSLGRAEALRSLSIALWTLGHFEEAIEAGLESHRIAEQGEAPRTMVTAAFMIALGYLGIDIDKAHEWSERGIDIAAANALTWAEAMAKSLDGIVWTVSGDMARAQSRFSEALTVQRPLGDFEGSGLSLAGLALIANDRGELARSIDLYCEAQGAFAQIGVRAEEARVLSEMARPYIGANDFTSARRSLLASIDAYSDIGSTRGIGTSLIGLAALEALEHRDARAVSMATTAEILARDEGIVNVYSQDVLGHDEVERARGTLSPAALEEAAARGSRLTLAEALVLAREHA